MWRWLTDLGKSPSPSAPTRSSKDGEVCGRDRHRPAGSWVIATPRIKVVGIQHRFDDVRGWAEGVRLAEKAGRYYGVELVPEPDNRHDPNAIKVIGLCDFNGKRLDYHIGYLAREWAEDIQTSFLAEGIPIACELYSVFNTLEFIDVNLLILAPPGNSYSKRMRNR